MSNLKYLKPLLLQKKKSYHNLKYILSSVLQWKLLEQFQLPPLPSFGGEKNYPNLKYLFYPILRLYFLEQFQISAKLSIAIKSPRGISSISPPQVWRKKLSQFKISLLPNFAIISPGSILNICSVQFCNKISYRNLRYFLFPVLQYNTISQFSDGIYVKFRASPLTNHWTFPGIIIFTHILDRYISKNSTTPTKLSTI